MGSMVYCLGAGGTVLDKWLLLHPTGAGQALEAPLSPSPGAKEQDH